MPDASDWWCVIALLFGCLLLLEGWGWECGFRSAARNSSGKIAVYALLVLMLLVLMQGGGRKELCRLWLSLLDALGGML